MSVRGTITSRAIVSPSANTEWIMSRSPCSTTPRCSARSTSSRSSTWVANGPSRKPLPGVNALPIRISSDASGLSTRPSQRTIGAAIPADRVRVLAPDRARRDADDHEDDDRHRAGDDQRRPPAGAELVDRHQRDQRRRAQLAQHPQQQQQVEVPDDVGGDRLQRARTAHALAGQLAGARDRHRVERGVGHREAGRRARPGPPRRAAASHSGKWLAGIRSPNSAARRRAPAVRRRPGGPHSSASRRAAGPAA